MLQLLYSGMWVIQYYLLGFYDLVPQSALLCNKLVKLEIWLEKCDYII